MPDKPLSFQDLILKLHDYWSRQGCVILQAYDVEVGAGTLNPATVLRALGPKPWKVAYVQPSRRPADGRYGENPNRLRQHHQYQVVLKPNPANLQALYLGSLEAIGIDPKVHDIRFVEDDWENPTVGAWGLGWEVWCDGMEITQYTYFQQVGGLDVFPVAGELTIGLERLSLYLQNVDSVYDLRYNDEFTYGEVVPGQRAAVLRLRAGGSPTWTSSSASLRTWSARSRASWARAAAKASNWSCRPTTTC